MDRETIMRQILCRQHITAPADKNTVCRDLCGLQAQFLSGARHGLGIRCREPLGEDWGRGMVKSWTIRGTVHVFREEDLPLFLHEGRSHSHRPVDNMESDRYITQARKQYFAGLIVDAIGEGTDSREALKARCYAAGLTEGEAESIFDPWGGTIRYLAEAGKICYKVQEKKAFQLCPDFEPMEYEAAWTELLRRYFTGFGPATLRDAAYFFGKPQRELRRWMQKLPLREISVEGQMRYVLGDVPETLPDCVFLSGFDQLMLGYEKRESLFLPQEHLRGIFNLAGIVMPAVLLRGRVAGRWKLEGRGLNLWLFSPLTPQEADWLRKAAAGTFPSVKTMKVREYPA